MKVDYGAVALIPKGEFNATKQYAVNDLVSYNGSSFIVKAVPPIGTLPTNTAYFAINASGTSPATSSTVGTVKPDNSTIVVDNNGVISVKSEVLDRVSSSEQALTVNLLDPNLKDWSDLGLTVVKNSNITYTITGTYTGSERKILSLGAPDRANLENGKTYRLTGIPAGAENISIRIGNDPHMTDEGNGATGVVTFPINGGFKLYVDPGFSAPEGITIKPMITTNLSATYDDFVPFSGSSGKLDTDFKTLSEKIGNVGNTDLQSQLNAATQSIAQNTADVAQNTTDIAANAAGITALNTGLANISNAVQPIGNVKYSGIDTVNITQQQINTWVDANNATLTLNAGSYMITLYAYAPSIGTNAFAYISIFNDQSYYLFEKLCAISNGTNITRDAYVSITIPLTLRSSYTFHPIINANSVMSNVTIELSAMRIK